MPERLDTRGTFCPVPILLTARKLSAMAPGRRLEIVGDDPGIEEDMPVWCAETGHRLVEMEHTGDEIRCVVEVAKG